VVGASVVGEVVGASVVGEVVGASVVGEVVGVVAWLLKYDQIVTITHITNSTENTPLTIFHFHASPVWSLSTTPKKTIDTIIIIIHMDPTVMPTISTKVAGLSVVLSFVDASLCRSPTVAAATLPPPHSQHACKASLPLLAKSLIAPQRSFHPLPFLPPDVHHFSCE